MGLTLGQAVCGVGVVGHCKVQVGAPATTVQLRPGAQVLEQLPQCCGSLLVLTQVPLPQSERGAGQESVTQLPLWQTWPLAQTVPQVPQLLRSVAVLTHWEGVPHFVSGAGQETPQAPPEQTCPLGQMVSQVPQLRLSRCVSTQVPPQLLKPLWQASVHCPEPPGPVAVQTSPAGQRTPQAPQLLPSVEVSRQVPPQFDCPLKQKVLQAALGLEVVGGWQTSPLVWLQRVPQSPQLLGSVVTSTQLPLHRFWAPTQATKPVQSLSLPQIWFAPHSLVEPGVLQGNWLGTATVQATPTSDNESSRVRKFMVPRSEVPESDRAHRERERHADQDVGDGLLGVDPVLHAGLVGRVRVVEAAGQAVGMEMQAG